jgi:hypothetical protein
VNVEAESLAIHFGNVLLKEVIAAPFKVVDDMGLKSVLGAVRASVLADDLAAALHIDPRIGAGQLRATRMFPSIKPSSVPSLTSMFSDVVFQM